VIPALLKTLGDQQHVRLKEVHEASSRSIVRFKKKHQQPSSKVRSPRARPREGCTPTPIWRPSSEPAPNCCTWNPEPSMTRWNGRIKILREHNAYAASVGVYPTDA